MIDMLRAVDCGGRGGCGGDCVGGLNSIDWNRDDDFAGGTERFGSHRGKGSIGWRIGGKTFFDLHGLDIALLARNAG